LAATIVGQINDLANKGEPFAHGLDRLPRVGVGVFGIGE
jgi:hypothetical protein